MTKRLRNSAAILAALALGLLGRGLLDSEPAHAAEPAPGFSECFAATVWHAQGRELNNGNTPRKVSVPSGWTPVGGTGVGNHPAVVLCR